MTNLKKIQFLFIIVTPVLSYGQKEILTFGLNSGVNISYFDDKYSQTNLFLGYSIGAKLRITPKLKKNLKSRIYYFESGINYIKQGYAYTIDKQRMSLRQRQVEIPFYFIGKVSKKVLSQQMIKKKISVVVKVGAVASFQRQYKLMRTFSANNQIINEQITQKPLNIFGVGGLGLEREFDNVILGIGVTAHASFLTSTEGSLTSNVQIPIWNYKYRSNYFSLDIFFLIKNWSKLKRHTKTISESDDCATP
ncbi:MAG: hypothetical protein ABIP51_00305 [Bacteroidia bacterium]